MIIYALIIIAILFFLSWNLISNEKLHIGVSLVTTVLFVAAVFLAVANLGFHYGMHRVNEPVRSHRIYSLSPMKSLNVMSYRPMGNHRDSQIVIYKNHHQKVIHTQPTLSVHNQIIRQDDHVKAHVVTKAIQWEYRNAWDRMWFNLAKKPSTEKVTHVFYVPRSWKLLTDKQTLAFKQIIKNKRAQLKRQMKSSRAKQQLKQRASAYVKGKVAVEMRKNPNLSAKQKKLIMTRALKAFKLRSQHQVEDRVVVEAIRTAETTH